MRVRVTCVIVILSLESSQIVIGFKAVFRNIIIIK